MGIAVFSGLAVVLQETKYDCHQIGKSDKRGRPPKARAGLVRMNK